MPCLLEFIAVGKNYFVSLGIISSNNIYTNNLNKNIKQNKKILNVAVGTGNNAFRIIDYNKSKINLLIIKSKSYFFRYKSVDVGLRETRKEQKLGISNQQIQFVCANAQQLSFEANTFDAYTIALVSEMSQELKKGQNKQTECQKIAQSKEISFEIDLQILFIQNNSSDWRNNSKEKQSYQYIVQKFYYQEALLNIQSIKRVVSYCRYENLLMEWSLLILY